MMKWGIFTNNFSRKYTTFVLAPCIVAFLCSSVSFILYNNFCISLFQFVWISVGIIPVLGLSLALLKPTPSSIVEESKKRDEPLLEKTCHRQIICQVIFQSIIIIVTLIFGQRFIPEDRDDVDDMIGDDWAAKYHTSARKTVCSGVSDDIFQSRALMYIRVFE